MYSLVCITEPDFLPFLNASSVQKRKKTKIYKSEYRARNITQWFCRAIKLCIISVKIYTAIMVKITSEIKNWSQTPFFILVNNPKQPLQASNYLKNIF